MHKFTSLALLASFAALAACQKAPQTAATQQAAPPAPMVKNAAYYELFPGAIATDRVACGDTTTDACKAMRAATKEAGETMTSKQRWAIVQEMNRLSEMRRQDHARDYHHSQSAA